MLNTNFKPLKTKPLAKPRGSGSFKQKKRQTSFKAMDHSKNPNNLGNMVRAPPQFLDFDCFRRGFPKRFSFFLRGLLEDANQTWARGLV